MTRKERREAARKIAKLEIKIQKQDQSAEQDMANLIKDYNFSIEDMLWLDEQIQKILG